MTNFKFSKPGADGDMLYRSPSGLYVPASLGDYQVPQKQPGGTVIGVDVATPADLIALEASLEAYTDAKVAGLSWKQAVRAATTAAATLATSFENGDTVDGVTLATGDRILIKDQASAAENGIYVVAASGAPARATDADAAIELVNASVYVSEGTANADTQWTCSTNAPITLGTTGLTFAQLATGGGSASVGWRSSQVAALINNGNTRDLLTATLSNNGAVFLVSAVVTRLAFQASAEFVVPVQINSGSSAFAIVRAVRYSSSGANIGLEVNVNGGVVTFRGRNNDGSNFDSYKLVATCLSESPTWADVSSGAQAAISTTALYGDGRLRLQGIEQGGATDKQWATWNDTNKTWTPTSTGPNSGVSAGTYGSATQAPVLVVGADGRITSASQVTITGAGGNSPAEELISEHPVVGAAEASVTFSSIASSYRDLRVVVRARGDKAATSTQLMMRVNGDTGANYDHEVFLAAGLTFSGSVNQGIAGTSTRVGDLAASSAPVGVSGAVDIRVFDYAGTTFHKQWASTYAVKVANSSGSIFTAHGGGFWRSTSAITSITVFPDTGNFEVGSVITLYGIH